MFGSGPFGSAPFGDVFDDLAFASTSDILQKIVTIWMDEKKLSSLPARLHHYTSLDTAQKILEKDDVRLSHAEYSNDQMEMEQAKRVIAETLETLVQQSQQQPASDFLVAVQKEYLQLAPNLDAYIFCMSEGDQNSAKVQDRLSQWRAYGQDGRGVCLTLDASKLAHLVYYTPGLRINPVIYDRSKQFAFVNAIVSEGLNLNQAGNQSAITATVGALVFATPLMKAPGFSEEREWRLLFMPPAVDPSPRLEFHPRRDFLAPFLRLQYIWNDLGPQLASNQNLRPHPPLNVTRPTGKPLLPIEGVMVGPSGHQPLNLRAMTKLLKQTSWQVTPDTSDIPYRSIA